jgi:hypothetical protein
VSARDWLYARLTGALIDPSRVDAGIDVYRDEILREAAERIRTELADKVSEPRAGEVWTITTSYLAAHAADLIDPGVKS